MTALPPAAAPASTPTLPSPRFDEFPRYEALTRLLFSYAEACPNLV